MSRGVDGIPRVPQQRVTAKGEAAAEGKKKKRHGDTAIAAALAHFASDMPVVEYDYMPASALAGDSDHFDDDDGGRALW